MKCRHIYHQKIWLKLTLQTLKLGLGSFSNSITERQRPQQNFVVGTVVEQDRSAWHHTSIFHAPVSGRGLMTVGNQIPNAVSNERMNAAGSMSTSGPQHLKD
jgi:hypothetical protein